MIKNTASQRIGAQMVSASDGSAFTGSVTVAVTGDAGTQATGSVGSGACTHEGNGYHTYAPAQAETNYDLIAFTFTGTGAIPQTVQVFTVAGALATAAALSTVDTVVDGIKAVTDNLPDSGALSSLATAAALTTVDTVVDAILVDTAEIGASGAGLTAVPWNAAWDAEVQSEAMDALNAYDPPTKAELDSAVAPLATAAALATVDGIVDDILVDTADMQPKLGTPAASVSADIAAVKAQTAAIETDTQDLQTQVGTDGAGLTNLPWNASWDAQVQSEVQDALDATLADSVPSDGTRPSAAQAIYAIYQFLTERGVSGTTMTVRKADGSTTLMTFTLDDGTNPTSITRAS